jgi:exoribonuclease R
MSKKPKKLGNKPKDFTAQIFKILSREPSKSFNYKQIAAVLELSDTKSRNEIIRDLKILKAQDKIHETEVGKYQIISKAEYYEGIIDMTSRKTGYFICDELEDDVFVPFINLNHALDGDKVKAYIYNRRSSRKPEAEILEILERKKSEFVGVIDVQKNFAFVTTANAKMYTDIFIPKNKIGDAEHGDVVLVTLEDWPKKADSPFGS